MRRLGWPAVAWLVICILVAACGGPVATGVPGSSGQVVQAISADAASFQVYETTDASSRLYQFMVYASGLWRRDPATNQPIPYMAQSWTQSDDGKTFAFKLRPDMKWSDGFPITAQDFVWTFEQAVDPAHGYPYASILKDVVSYTAPDDQTLVVTLGTGSCVGILTAGQITPLPKHVWEKLDWSDAAKNPEISKPTVVSGPWLLQSWERDGKAVFVPNPTYFGAKAKLGSYIYRIVADSTVAQQVLGSGEVDYASVPATGFATAKGNANLALYQWDPAQPTWYFLGFNLRAAPFNDPAVRRALAQAIPKQQIADQLFGGLAKPLDTTYSPASWAYTSSVTKYDYDIKSAGDALTAAGYALDSNGKRLDKSGQPITLRLYAPAGDSIREQVAQIAQQEVGKLGIAVQITTLESQALFKFLTTNTSAWDMWVGLSRDTSDPNFAGQSWSSQTIPDINVGAYMSDQVDQLYAKANQPPCGVAQRQPVYQEIARQIATDVPYIFLVYNTGYAFVNKRVAPNAPSALGIDYAVDQWSVH